VNPIKYNIENHSRRAKGPWRQTIAGNGRGDEQPLPYHEIALLNREIDNDFGKAYLNLNINHNNN
jgi:hypothetical protein